MSDGLKLEITGLDETIKRLSPEQAMLGLREGMQVAVVRGHRRLSDNLSGLILKSPSGRYTLRKKISTEVTYTDSEVTGTITNTARWAWKGKSGSLLAVHEFGATIVPRDPTKWLVFKVGGQWVKTKKSVIPARKPLETTLNEIKDGAFKDLQTALTNRLNGQPNNAPTTGGLS